MSTHIDDRLKAIDARTFEAQVGMTVKRVHASIRMVESDPMVILTALVDLLVLFLVTELANRPRSEVRRQAFKFFRNRLDIMQDKQAQAEAMLGSANDE